MCALAVVLGLLSMHGLPFSGGDCSAPVLAASSSASGSMPMVMPALHQMGDCVTVAPSRSIPPVLALVAVLGLVVLVWRVVSGWRSHPVERPPPRAGVLLLLWVCVSRT